MEKNDLVIVDGYDEIGEIFGGPYEGINPDEHGLYGIYYRVIWKQPPFCLYNNRYETTTIRSIFEDEIHKIWNNKPLDPTEWEVV